MVRVKPDYYKYALGISYAIPSAKTLYQQFDMIGGSMHRDVRQANIDMFREMNIEPYAIDNGYVPVDLCWYWQRMLAVI